MRAHPLDGPPVHDQIPQDDPFLPHPTLPKGGGAIRGIGETFAA